MKTSLLYYEVLAIKNIHSSSIIYFQSNKIMNFFLQSRVGSLGPNFTTSLKFECKLGYSVPRG